MRKNVALVKRCISLFKFVVSEIWFTKMCKLLQAGILGQLQNSECGFDIHSGLLLAIFYTSFVSSHCVTFDWTCYLTVL